MLHGSRVACSKQDFIDRSLSRIRSILTQTPFAMLHCNARVVRPSYCAPRACMNSRACVNRALLPTSRLKFRGTSLNRSEKRACSRLRSFPGRVLPIAAGMTPSAERGAAISQPTQPLNMERNSSGLQRLAYQKEGWQYWSWNDSKTGQHRIHYISAGENNPGPTVLLIHGFGASAYHWRHNLPALVDAGRRVFAVDLLGGGLKQPRIHICLCPTTVAIFAVCPNDFAITTSFDMQDDLHHHHQHTFYCCQSMVLVSAQVLGCQIKLWFRTKTTVCGSGS